MRRAASPETSRTTGPWPGGFTPTPTEDGGERDFSRTKDWRLNLKAGFTPNDTDEYSISYTRQEGSKNAPLSTTDPLSVQRFWTWPYWNIDSLYFLSTTALGERATLRTKLYRNTFDNLLRSFDTRAQATQTLGRAFNSYYADETWGGMARVDFELTEADTLALAFHYRRDEHVEWQQGFPNGVTEPKQTSTEDVYSLGIENRLALSPTVSLTLGAGYDVRDLKRAEDFTNNAFVFYPLKDGHALSGQGAVSWRPDDRTEVHASVSSRQRFPTIFERFSSRFGGAVSNASLKPERATNFEIGGSQRWGGVEASGAIFYSSLKDVIVAFPFIFNSCTPAGACTPNAVTQSRNLGEGDYYGFEASLTAQLSPALSLGGNYTLTERDLDDPTNAAFRPTDVPRHKGFVYADWRPIPRLHLVPNLDVASDRWTVTSDGKRYYKTGAYAVANLRADYELTKGVEVGVGVRNLFDDDYQLVDGFPEQGRSFYASLRARY